MDLDTIDLDRHPECKDIRFVLHCARFVWKKIRHCVQGLEFDDLIGVGWAGLKQAHERYRYGNFEQYAKETIRRHMWTMVNQHRQKMYIPKCLHEQLLRVGRGLPLSGWFAERYKDTDEAIARASASLNMRRRGTNALVFQAMYDRGQEQVDNREFVEVALDCCNPEQRELLCRHYGLEGSEPISQRDLARELSTGPSNVTQKKHRAFRTIRNCLTI